MEIVAITPKELVLVGLKLYEVRNTGATPETRDTAPAILFAWKEKVAPIVQRATRKYCSQNK